MAAFGFGRCAGWRRPYSSHESARSNDLLRAGRRHAPRLIDAHLSRFAARVPDALTDTRDLSVRVHLHQVADPQAAGIGDLHVHVAAIAHPDVHEIAVRAAAIPDRM